MSDGSTVGSSAAYLYDGTFEGLMTAVFEAFAHRPMPASVWEADGYQPLFGERTADIAADTAKADRVIAGIRKTMGPDAYERVWLTFLSGQRDRGNWIYAYIRLGMEKGRRVHTMLTDDRVILVNKWSGLVSLESARFRQFVRFSRREGGVYYAGIQPDYDVVALMMPHFVDRLRIQPFVIHDKKRDLYGVYDTRNWYVTEAENVRLPGPAEEERDYQRLWKTFYDTIAIKERTNPRCRMHFMPKKYWKDLTEMTMDIPDRENTVFARELAAETQAAPLPPQKAELPDASLPPVSAQ